MNKKAKIILKAVSLSAALLFTIGCGKEESRKATKKTDHNIIQMTSSPAEETKYLYRVDENTSIDPSDPMYDIPEDTDNVSVTQDAAVSKSESTKITQQDIAHALRALEEQLE